MVSSILRQLALAAALRVTIAPALILPAAPAGAATKLSIGFIPVLDGYCAAGAG